MPSPHPTPPHPPPTLCAGQRVLVPSGGSRPAQAEAQEEGEEGEEVDPVPIVQKLLNTVMQAGLPLEQRTQVRDKGWRGANHVVHAARHTYPSTQAREAACSTSPAFALSCGRSVHLPSYPPQ